MTEPIVFFLTIALVALAVAAWIAIELAVTLAYANRRVASLEQLRDAQEVHIALLKDAQDAHVCRIAQLEGRNEHLQTWLLTLIKAKPPVSRPAQIEGLRDRLAARSMN